MMFAFAILCILAVLAALGLLSTTTDEVTVIPASADPLTTADEIEERQLEATRLALAEIRSMDLTARQSKVAAYVIDQIFTLAFAPARIAALSRFQCAELQYEALYLADLARVAPEGAQGAYGALIRDLAPASLLRFLERLATANGVKLSA